jgi:peptidoglycan/xylan/chitin deacetylase (PgdA/CDA1 family)
MNFVCRLVAQSVLFQPQVVFFHSVAEKLDDPRIEVLQTELREFEVLMRYLKQHYELISLNEYHERIKTAHPDLSRCVVVTFDDGYRSNHRLVAPLLGSLGIPFTIYLTTQGIETGERLPTFVGRAAVYLTERRRFVMPETGVVLPLETEAQRRAADLVINKRLKTSPLSSVRCLVAALRELLPADRWVEVEAQFQSDAFMNWAEVAELHRAGVTIGAHGHEHVPLHAGLEPGELAHQVYRSRDLIVRHLGHCEHYAFPNGTPEDISEEAVTTVMRAGFRTAVSTFPASLAASRHPFLLPRICVYRVDRFQRAVLRDRLNGASRRLRRWQARMPAPAMGSPPAPMDPIASRGDEP